MAKILIIDDQEVVGVVLCEMLEVVKHNAVWTTSWKIALKILQKEAWDIVITDMNMPEINGSEVLLYLKVNYPQIKTVAMTGGQGDYSAVDAINMTPDATFIKPINFNETKELIKYLGF